MPFTCGSFKICSNLHLSRQAPAAGLISFVVHFTVCIIYSASYNCDQNKIKKKQQMSSNE